MEDAKYTYHEMQELLPDYVFRRLSLEEARKFELTLPDFPDLVEEVKQVKAVFGRVEEMDLDAEITDRTRNLSVRVQNKLRQRSVPGRYNMIMKYIVPALGLFALAIFTFMNGGVSDKVNKKASNTTVAKTDNTKGQGDGFKILSPGEAGLIINSKLTDDDIIEIAGDYNINKGEELVAEYAYDADAIDKELNEMLNKSLDKLSPEDLNKIYPPTGTAIDIMEEFNTLDESEFQKLLKEIENADIAS